MNDFLKAAGLVLVSLILCLVLSVQNKSLAALLTITVCVMICILLTEYIRPVMDFVIRLQDLGDLDTDVVGVVIKSVGIGMLSEIVTHICSDSGMASLGKTLQLLSSAIILWMALPLLTGLIDLVTKILSNL